MKIKLPYGTTAENNALTLPMGQLSIDMDKKAIRLHDGATPGGLEVIGVQSFIAGIGEDWTNVGTALTLSAFLCEIGGIFYCYQSSGNGALKTSTNLTSWTTKLSFGGGQDFRAFKRVQDYVVAAWFSTTSGGSLFTRWINAAGTLPATTSIASTGAPEDADFAYFNGLYVASSRGSRIHTATDPVGGTWTTRLTVSKNFIHFVTTPTHVYAFTNDSVYHSTDATTWTLLASNAPAATFAITDQVGYRNGVFVAATYASNTTKIYSSTDAINWTLRHTSVTDGTVTITGGFVNMTNNIVLLGKLRTVLSSTDGVNWTYKNEDWGSTIEFFNSSMVHSTTGKLYGLADSLTVYRAD